MATVYLAIQRSLDRKVAIKVLHTTHDDEPEKTERRFLREGRTLAKLSHKNICGIYDIAKIGDTAYIAMEFLDGGNLVDRLKGGMTVAEAIASVVQVASALAESHAQGIVHRDLKPANVMMRGSVPVLTDFGIARELTANQTKITAENMIVGTPAYMSPEQVTGGEVDGRSDIYSLGIMFFELLTGQVPYRGDTPIAVCMQHLTSPLPQLPPELKELQPILDRMLAKKPDERYSNMADFTQSLRNAFVVSLPLRSAMQFTPDQPWSEQLRNLGFTFDTLKDADVRAALEAQRAEAKRAAPAPGAGVRSPAAAQANSSVAQPQRAAVRPQWLLWVAASVLLLISAISMYVWQSRGLNAVEMRAMQAATKDFGEYLTRGKLFGEGKEHAAAILEEMRDISRRDGKTNDAEQMLWDAAQTAARDAAKAGQADVAQTVINESSRYFPNREAEIHALASELEGTLGEVLAEQSIGSIVERLEDDLNKPRVILVSLSDDIVALRKLAKPDDVRLLRIEALVDGKYAQRTSVTMGADIGRARVVAGEWLAILPQSKKAQQMIAALEDAAGRQDFGTALTRLAAGLQAEDFGVGNINAFASEYSRLKKLPQAASKAREFESMEQSFVARVAGAAEAQLDKNAAQAESLVREALVALPQNATLRALQGRITQAGEAQARAARSGELAIVALPWAKLISVTGKAMVQVPPNAETPLVLSLPEGAYTIELSGPNGQTRKQTVSVQRQNQATIRVDLRTGKVDDLLREAGY